MLNGFAKLDEDVSGLDRERFMLIRVIENPQLVPVVETQSERPRGINAPADNRPPEQPAHAAVSPLRMRLRPVDDLPGFAAEFPLTAHCDLRPGSSERLTAPGLEVELDIELPEANLDDGRLLEAAEVQILRDAVHPAQPPLVPTQNK